MSVVPVKTCPMWAVFGEMMVKSGWVTFLPSSTQKVMETIKFSNFAVHFWFSSKHIRKLKHKSMLTARQKAQPPFEQVILGVDEMTDLSEHLPRLM